MTLSYVLQSSFNMTDTEWVDFDLYCKITRDIQGIYTSVACTLFKVKKKH